MRIILIAAVMAFTPAAAAAQGLVDQVRALSARLDALEAENARLQGRVDALEAAQPPVIPGQWSHRIDVTANEAHTFKLNTRPGPQGLAIFRLNVFGARPGCCGSSKDHIVISLGHGAGRLGQTWGERFHKDHDSRTRDHVAVQFNGDAAGADHYGMNTVVVVPVSSDGSFVVRVGGRNGDVGPVSHIINLSLLGVL